MEHRTPVARPLPLGDRTALRLRHTARLSRDLYRFASGQRIWWLLPAVVVLLLLAAATTATTSALPVAVYTLF